MKRWLVSIAALALSLCQGSALFAQGPYDPEDWPLPFDETRIVHYVSTDSMFPPAGPSWIENGLQILTGGDQVTEAITIGGHNGVQVTGSYLNVKDPNYAEWADDEVIDILVQVYGDEALFGAGGAERTFTFLTGVLPNLNFPSGGSIPVDCKNKKWNWILFRIPNADRGDGTRFVGSIPANPQGDYSGGGVNGGTIRFEAVPGLKVRLVAFGEQGAFGEPADINVCETGEECPPEPETNLVWIDIDADTSDHLVLLDDGDQLTTIEEEVGPADDLRRAAIPDGVYMNFGITDNYLGEPCNDPRAVKICVEFYDDPNLIGTSFGPEAYATDDMGGVAFVASDRYHILMGTDAWIRRSWVVPSVCLAGINTTPLTGGPRLYFNGGQVPVSKVSLAILRTGTHPLAGQDPLEDCYADPFICTDAYGNYAELDFELGIRDGLAPGTSGGDQEMIVEEAGPGGDRRMAVRPAFDDGTPGFAHNFLNFSIVGEPFGPSSQPNAHLAICVTYYDDPALAGATFRPEVYQVERNGALTLGFTDPSIALALEGTDAWREAYFEIQEIKFNGVNQGPQAAARFALSGKIFFTTIRYGVIRPCGPFAGENPVEDCNPICTDAYGNYAELDLDAEIEDGLAPGTSGGDQEMIIEEAGPVGDRRVGVRPAFDDGTPPAMHNYLNFAITEQIFGPTSQPNAYLTMCITYYDDPALTGATFRPEAYQVERDGALALGFTDASIAVTLEGTDTWREAYFEIPEIKFNGVNQGPQAAARFELSDKIFFTSVRYGIIRPCGPFAGQNPLEGCGEATETEFIRADTDGNGMMTIGDGVQVLERLFSDRERFDSNCEKTGDVDDNGILTIGDAISVFNLLFASGVDPQPPYPACGTDPTDDVLPCEGPVPACP
ncbi:MAG: hypothetical protein JXP34_16290 [Planctomycetes bacterium]|nr:hypothetical protein [Planctomycetota bacterium]